jgi:hypothetical protein
MIMLIALPAAEARSFLYDFLVPPDHGHGEAGPSVPAVNSSSASGGGKMPLRRFFHRLRCAPDRPQSSFVREFGDRLLLGRLRRLARFSHRVEGRRTIGSRQKQAAKDRFSFAETALVAAVWALG